MINVMHIVSSLKVGGLEKLVVDMCKLAVEKDFYKPFICSLDGSHTFIKRDAINYDIEVISVNQGRRNNRLFDRLKMHTVIKDKKIDILHSHNAAAHVNGVFWAKCNRIPIVHTKHGNVLPFQTFKHEWQNKLAARWTNCLVAVSQEIQKKVIEGYNVPSDKVVLIHNGININRFQCKHNEANSENQKVFRIGAVGRLSPEKDYLTMLKAIRDIINNDFNIQLDIVGDGDQKQELQEEARSLGISEQINFLGERHDIPELLNQFDVFVQSSLMEGMSLTILEAMASGLPVVATDVGGNPEVIVDKQTGFLVSKKNPAQLAEAIINIISDCTLIKKMGNAGRKRIEENFGISTMVQQYLNIYQEILEKRGRRLR